MRHELINEESYGEFSLDVESRKNYNFEKYNVNVDNYRRLAQRAWHLYDNDDSLRMVVILKESLDYSKYPNDTTIANTSLIIKLPASQAYDIIQEMKSTVDDASPVSTYSKEHKDGCTLEAYLSSVSNNYLVPLFDVLQKNKLFCFSGELIDEIKQLKYDRIYSEEDIAYYNAIDNYITRREFEESLTYTVDVLNKLESHKMYENDYFYYLGKKLSTIPEADTYASMSFRYVDSASNYYTMSLKEAFLIIRAKIGDTSLSKVEKNFWVKEMVHVSLEIGKKTEFMIALRILDKFCLNSLNAEEFLDSSEIFPENNIFLGEDLNIHLGAHVVFAIACTLRKNAQTIKKLQDELEVLKMSNHPKEVAIKADKSEQIGVKVNTQANTCMFSGASSTMNKSLNCQFEDLSWVKKMSDFVSVDYMLANPKSYALVKYNSPKF